MLHYSKKILIAGLLSSFILYVRADEAPDFSSGQARMHRITFNDETGVDAYTNKLLHPVETENLSEDLNIPKIAEFFECKTIIGQSFIERALAQPLGTHDKGIIMRRQSIIKALVEDPELKQDIEDLLLDAKRYEQEVIQLLSERFILQTCPELYDLEYCQKRGSWLPMFVNRFMTFNAFGWGMTTATRSAILAACLTVTYKVGETAYNAVDHAVRAYINDVKRQIRAANPGISDADMAQMLQQVAEDFRKKVFAFIERFRQDLKRMNPEQIAAVTLTLSALATVTYYGVSSVYNNASTLYRDYCYASDKRLKLHALNKLLQIAEKFERRCQEQNIRTQFKVDMSKDPQAISLIKNLKKSRYAQDTSYAFSTANVHTFLHTVYKEDKHLAPIFSCIAEMDAYNAIATKMIESQKNENKFCYVEFVGNKNPSFKAELFWNMLVKNPVLNGITENKNIILTGPNAGGKTTAIRAIVQNIVLGQTFGIAAAATFEYTMFDIIHSYLNISDDILNGDSLFKAEVKRAQAILVKIKSLEADKKYFFALDELFTGTAAEDGEECANAFISRIVDAHGVQFIYATHFKKLKEIANNKSTCANYKVDLPSKDENGKLVYPFTLSQGASTVNIGLDVAREAGLFD